MRKPWSPDGWENLYADYWGRELSFTSISRSTGKRGKNRRAGRNGENQNAHTSILTPRLGVVDRSRAASLEYTSPGGSMESADSRPGSSAGIWRSYTKTMPPWCSSEAGSIFPWIFKKRRKPRFDGPVTLSCLERTRADTQVGPITRQLSSFPTQLQCY